MKLLALLLLASSAHAEIAVVNGVNTASNTIIPINATTSASINYLRVMTVPAPGAAGTQDVTSRGATIASTQTTITVAATSILASSATRRAVTFVNESTSVSFWLGPSGVTTATGTRVTPRSSATFNSSAGAAWFAITSSSTAVCDALTESD